jgi:nucleoside-diphosphate-sugar epimerase
MKILITGAPGWLGDRFLEAVKGTIPELKALRETLKPEEIRCLVHPDFAERFRKSNPGIQASLGDLTDRDSLHNFFKNADGAVLFHLAGLVHATRGVKQFYEINVEGTRHILSLAIQNRVKRIVAISSNSPAGCNPRRDHLFTEDMPYNPYMAYGRSKMQMELLLREAYEKKQIETVILRPCWFYGPGQPPRQTLFFSMIKNGKAPVVGSGENRRSMSYVDNVSQALLLAAGSEKANGQTYWITDSKPYSMNEIVDTVERLLEKEFKMPVKHKRLRLPSIASEVALVTDAALQAAGIYQQKIHVLSEMNKTIAASIEKARRELQYSPAVDLEEGMRRSIRWCLEQGHPL